LKPPDFDYQAPPTLDGALGILRDDPGAKVLAGGQSLIPLLGLRLASPSLLVDLRRVPGLDTVERRDGVVRIGAMVRQRRAEQDAVLLACAPLLSKATRHVAHPQIRSRGTIGGSVAHADPAAEIPAVLVALEGRICTSSPSSERVHAAEQFFTGFLSTLLASDEIVTAIELDVPRPRTGTACVEVTQRAGDYALCGAVAQVSLSESDTVEDARVALLGVADRAVRARATETALVGEAPTAAAAAAAARQAGHGISPIEDPQAPAEYRLHLADVVTRRALEQAMDDATP
jgi:carbon-monoxide dehydrogenase medium subunit